MRLKNFRFSIAAVGLALLAGTATASATTFDRNRLETQGPNLAPRISDQHTSSASRLNNRNSGPSPCW